jgi:predicted GTPase
MENFFSLKPKVPNKIVKPDSSNESDIKINIYGKTGAGKSTLCNIILGREEFKVGHDL